MKALVNDPKKYCLESDFLIDLLSEKENAVKVYKEIKGAQLTISSIVLFEILRGEEKNKEKIEKFKQLMARLDVMPFGEQEAKEAVKIEKSLKNRGIKIDAPDLFIAAISKANDAILISNDGNYKNIEELNVKNY